MADDQQAQLDRALLDAAERGDDDQVLSLLAQQADVNHKAGDSLTSLHRATLNGFASTCQVLIDNKADIDARIQRNRTPLHCAAANGCASVCQVLISTAKPTSMHEIAATKLLFIALSSMTMRQSVRF
jgi:ankyrin repeat protein